MEPKKISFSFSKINKKSNLFVNKETQKFDSKVELIKCLEGQEIKLVEEKPEEAPLIIPLKENQKTSTALASLIKRRAVLLGEDEAEPAPLSQEGNDKATDAAINETEDIEKRAAKELLAELNAQGSLNSDTNLVLPVVHPDDLPLEGAKESSMDDYESIPIQDFGKAMLRGMGWVEPPKATIKGGGPPVDEMPSVRPKGMGLGADKALKAKPLLVAPESNEVLEIKRNAFVRILGGKHKDLYGQIEGFDDHAGRVIVRMAIGGTKEAFNEFLCQPISRKEYAQYGKCINTAKYEEYKSKENEHGQIILKKEETENYRKDSKINQKTIEERDRGPGKHQNMKYKKEIQEISSDESKEIYDRKPKQELKEEKSSGSREQGGSNYESQRGRDGRRDDRDRSRRGHGEDERLSKHVKNEDRIKDNNKDDKIYKTARKREYPNNSYDETRNIDSRKDKERSRGRYDSKYENDDGSYRKRDSNRDNRRGEDNEERNGRSRKASTSDESGSDERSKHKKCNKNKKSKKKSKKNKKSKSKYHDSTDSESSSSSSSDSEAERRKRHKKKTKKSKKQRERSRSRDRR